jgi:hypothetical protein
MEEIRALRLDIQLPEEYQQIHKEAFGTELIFLENTKYLLHPNSGNPIESLLVEARTQEKQLIGFFLIFLQDIFGSVWSICKTKKYSMPRFFQRTLQYFLTHIAHVPFIVMIASKETTYGMTEKNRLMYYSSIGFRITRGCDIFDESDLIHKVIEDDGKFIDVSGGRLSFEQIRGVDELRMVATRDDILRSH